MPLALALLFGYRNSLSVQNTDSRATFSSVYLFFLLIFMLFCFCFTGLSTPTDTTSVGRHTNNIPPLLPLNTLAMTSANGGEVKGQDSERKMRMLLLALEGRVVGEAREQFLDDFKRLCVEDELTARKLNATNRELNEVCATLVRTLPPFSQPYPSP